MSAKEGTRRLSFGGLLVIALSVIHLQNINLPTLNSPLNRNALAALKEVKDNNAAHNFLEDIPEIVPTNSTDYHFTLQELYKKDGTMQISRQHKVLFVHTPKTGGTSIERSDLFKDKREIGNKKAAGHTKIQAFRQRAKNIEGYTSFSLVRHPCERFLSAFHYMKQGGQHWGDKTWAKENIGNDTLEEWVQRGINDQYAHFRPMWHFVFLQQEQHQKQSTKPKLVMGVDQIFCQEQFEEAIHWVNTTFGNGTIFPEVPHKNKGVVSHGGCQALSEDTRHTIEAFYAMDYCVFNYEIGTNPSSHCRAQGLSKEMFTRRFEECQTTIMGNQTLELPIISRRQRRQQQRLRQKRKQRQMVV